MRRSDRERDFDFAVEVLKSAPYATIAFGGEPYCIPISPVYHNGFIYFHGAGEGMKGERLQKDPKVCLSAVSQADPKPGRFGLDYRSAVFFGNAEIVSDPDEKLAALIAITETHAPAAADRIIKYAKGFFDRVTVFRITVDSATGKECIKK